MMFFLFVSGASAWTVGMAPAPVQYTSPVVEYAAPAGFLGPRAGVPMMAAMDGAAYEPAPQQPTGNAGVLVALCGLGALAGYGLGRKNAAFALAGQRSALPRQARRAGPVKMIKSRALPWQECPAHMEGMIGNAGFDPLGLSTPKNIKWMREAEIEHGRLCMLAWTGYVAVDLGIKFPGTTHSGIPFADLSSFTAHDATARYELFFALLLTGTCETIKFSPIYDMMTNPNSDRKPGDFGFDPLKLLTPDNEEQYKTAELTHGRAAMLAFGAVVTQSALGHPAFPYVN